MIHLQTNFLWINFIMLAFCIMPHFGYYHKKPNYLHTFVLVHYNLAYLSLQNISIHYRSITISPEFSTSFNICSRTAASGSIVSGPGNSMIVSTQARAQAPLPDFVPPSTRRFVMESGTTSHRADVGCVSDRSTE